MIIRIHTSTSYIYIVRDIKEYEKMKFENQLNEIRTEKNTMNIVNYIRNLMKIIKVQTIWIGRGIEISFNTNNNN